MTPFINVLDKNKIKLITLNRTKRHHAFKGEHWYKMIFYEVKKGLILRFSHILFLLKANKKAKTKFRPVLLALTLPYRWTQFLLQPAGGNSSLWTQFSLTFTCRETV
jgi:hypothetical protein